MSKTGSGAYTGEIAPEMLVNLNIPWVIIGHSERRELYGELNDVVAAKVLQAQDKGLNAMVCIGEHLQEREDGYTNVVLKRQLDSILDSVSDWSKIVIAYEPIWAIGTGKTATPQMAEDTHKFIRNWLEFNISEKVANETRIQYGGSVKAANAAELISMENIDGFLVGGASLTKDFIEIVKAADNNYFFAK